MTTKIDRARDAVAVLLQTSNPQDEFSLTTFANQPTVVQDFTSSANDIRSQLPFTSPKGSISLIDAIVFSISQMRKARHQRKVMVIISDVGDTRTRYSEKDVKSLIKEADVLVYSIGAFDREFQTLEERLGPSPISIIPFTTKWSWSPTADAFVWETRN